MSDRLPVTCVVCGVRVPDGTASCTPRCEPRIADVETAHTEALYEDIYREWPTSGDAPMEDK